MYNLSTDDMEQIKKQSEGKKLPSTIIHVDDVDGQGNVYDQSFLLPAIVKVSNSPHKSAMSYRKAV